MDPVIAICEGGPLDGQCVYALRDEEGSPAPLTSRQEVCGALYVPSEAVPEMSSEDERFVALLATAGVPADNAAAVEAFAAHVAAHDVWVYVEAGPA